MSTQRNNPIAKAVRFALIGGAAAATTMAPAVFAAEEESAESAERIEITGSRIKRTDVETASPVITIDREDISSAGYTNVEEILNNLPAVVAGQTAYISNGATGTATVDLRGLGTARTLVLVNGRRLPPGGVGTEAPDINSIPAAMVERVEVLTGGGSSVYGSDAVAGVVNFILRRDFEGVEVSFGASGYQHDNDNSFMQGLQDARGFDYPTGDSGLDGRGESVSIIMGGTFEKGHAVAYATWRKNDELRQDSRDYSSCALTNSATACGGSGTADIPNFYFYNRVFDAGTGTYSTDYTNLTGRVTLDENSQFSTAPSVYNFAPPNFFIRPNERFTLGAEASYEVNANFRPFVEVGYMVDKTNAQIAESGTFFGEELYITLDNPLLNAGQVAYLRNAFGIDPGVADADAQVAVYIGKRNTEGGPRQQLTDYNSSRIVVGADGEISDSWSYEASFTHAAVSSSLTYKNDLIFDRIGSSIGAIGKPDIGTPFYEVFTYNGVTAEQATRLAGTGVQVSSTLLDTFNMYATGDLPFEIPSAGAPVSAVVGYEHRITEFESISDDLFESGALAGQGGASPSVGGRYTVSEFFGEFYVPLVSDMPGIKSLDLEVGARSTDYSTSGRVTTYKYGLNWDVIDELKVRAAFNRAIRAPRVTELFASNSLALWAGSDPCAGTIDNDPDTVSPTATAAQCANSGVTAGQYGNISASPAGQYNQFTGGNVDLDPETADSVTFGFVVAPLENLSFTIDYYDIEIEDVIGTIGANLILQQCVFANNLCENVNRSPSGSLWLGNSGFIDNRTLNQGSATWRGLDISADYSMDLGEGRLRLNLTSSQQIEQTVEPLKGFDIDCAGEVNENCAPTPEWRHVLSANYAIGDWGVTARWRYFGDVDYTSAAQTDTLAQGGIDAYDWFDLVGSYQATENIGVMVGINNVLDEEPPIVGQTLASNGNTFAGQYDTLGRFLFANVTITY